MDALSPDHQDCRKLASYLAQRREAILSAWRKAVDLDPGLTTASTITRCQFVDHIPAVLDAFERRLCAEDPRANARLLNDQKEHAAEHGLHRWQQGYHLHETMCEWGHLHACLLEELEYFSTLHPQLQSNVLPFARRALVRLCSDGVCASAARYTNLHQAEAASRVRDLEVALVQLHALEHERAEAWREAAHDLRGSAHVIANATAMLSRQEIPAAKRTQFSDALRIGVESLNRLLADLMDHARLEAGHEHRSVCEFDAAVMLVEFCDSMRPIAVEHNLFLKCEGTRSLDVQGDPVKIRRIVQNLVLNAFKATQHGGVLVSWEESGDARRPQWTVCVQDTGPGFKAELATPLEHILKEATVEALAVQQRAQTDALVSTSSEPAPTLASRTEHPSRDQASGEGIGLSIVKRLCELLDASLELQTAEGEGSTFRVTFPRRYLDQ